MPPWPLRSLTLGCACALAMGACGGEDKAPAPVLPSWDAGDASANDAARGDGGYDRPDGSPRLPPADTEIELPLLGPARTVEIELDSSLRALDVHLSIDTTASFNDEITVLQDELSEVILPELRKRIADVSVGVSGFEDFPTPPWGGEDDEPFRLHTAITSQRRRIDSALARLNDPIGNGADSAESGAEALYQVATGEGYALAEWTVIAPYSQRSLPGGGNRGGVGFRDGAFRVVVHITDAPSHTPEDYALSYPDTHSLEDATDALVDIEARVLGIVSRLPEVDSPARPELEALAVATGAVMPSEDDTCPTGIDGEVRPASEGVCPLVFDVRQDGRGLSTTLVDAIEALVNTVELDQAYTGVAEDPLRFVSAVQALEADAEPGTPLPTLLDRRPEDGVADTFENVRPGTTLRFAVHLRNTLIAEDDAPQYFPVVIDLLGDGLALGRHTIRVKIPARNSAAAGDAGMDGGPQDDASTL